MSTSVLSLEADTLIEKIEDLKKINEDKDKLGLTAELLKKREELKSQIEKRLNGEGSEDESEENTKTSDEEKSDESSDESSTSDTDEDQNNSDEKSSEDEESSSEESSDTKEETKDQDDGFTVRPKKDDSNDKEEKKSTETVKEKEEEEKKEDDSSSSGSDEEVEDKIDDIFKISEESSMRLYKAYISNIAASKSYDLIEPMKMAYESYKSEMKKLGIGSRMMLSFEDQPVVYTKLKVLETLNNIALYSSQIMKNFDDTIPSVKKSLEAYMEKITIYQTYTESDKIHLTLKMFDNKDILKNIYNSTESDINKSLRSLTKYADDTHKLVIALLENDLTNLPDLLRVNKFKEENGEFVYDDALPGFEYVRVRIKPFTSYIESKLSDYEIYSMTKFSLEDKYKLSPMIVKDIKTLDSLLDKLNSLFTNFTMMLESIDDIKKLYTDLLTEIKNKVYDIEKDVIKDYGSLGLDMLMKNSLKTKLALEALVFGSISINRYFSSMMEVLGNVAEIE